MSPSPSRSAAYTSQAQSAWVVMTCWSLKVPRPSVFSYQAILSSTFRGREDVEVAIAVEVGHVDRDGSEAGPDGLRGDDSLLPEGALPVGVFMPGGFAAAGTRKENVQVAVTVEVGGVDVGGFVG